MKTQRRGMLYIATHQGRLAMGATRREAMTGILTELIKERLHAAKKTTTDKEGTTA